jgi:type IV pilus assembly protein PilA
MNKKLVISMAVLLLVAGCGGGLASSPPNDTVLQARWDQNFAEVAQVPSAIAKCLESKNNGLTVRCDSLVSLASGDFLPQTYTLAASRFEAAAPVIRGSLVLVGNEEAGNCTVTVRHYALWHGMAWYYDTEGGAHCSRAIGPRMAWSAALSTTAGIRSAIEECSKKYDGILAANCDSFPALARNGFPHVMSIASTHMSGATITAGTAAVVLPGSAAINSCVVTITPTVTEKGMTWAYTISRSDKTPVGEKCDRTTTGIGT